MTESRNVEALREGQRACLRLVLAGYEAKEIAIELGVPPTTVIERLRAARELLGVSRSKDAARILARHEGVADHNRLVPKPDVVAGSVLSQPNIVSPGGQAMEQGWGGSVEIREAQAAFIPFAPAPHRPSANSAPSGTAARKGPVDSAGLRNVMAVAVGFGTAVCLAFLAALILTRLLHAR
jgi:DNA-binding CsgD family transcriptional regulator